MVLTNQTIPQGRIPLWGPPLTHYQHSPTLYPPTRYKQIPTVDPVPVPLSLITSTIHKDPQVPKYPQVLHNPTHMVYPRQTHNLVYQNQWDPPKRG
ncbi:hypothetical protein G9A89_000343 [Geosiphon pyriformis]|nr:hypothetical protein G9A89_000343 [Geosiphon pyriformis]